MRNLIVAAAFLGCLFAEPARAQVRNGGAGSTAQGDILRGEGVFLQGAGWYDLNEAKAMAINIDTARKMDAWNMEVYEAYRREWNTAIAQKRNQTKAQVAAARRKAEEREARLRTKPTADDVLKGDALNALLTDLSDPTIDRQRWHSARLELPETLSVRSLVFRFAPRPGARGNKELGTSVIALARLDVQRRWPTVLRGDEIKTEREAYESVYRKVCDRCRAGSLDIKTLLEMDRVLKTLQARVNTKIPTERGFRVKADRFVRQLIAATKMFDAETIDYAQEMVADTQKHEAHSVEELLGFMRKYRLMFAAAGDEPATGELYRQLYGIMREEKELLGLKTETVVAKGIAPDDAEEFAGKKYKVFAQEMTWHEAKAQCEEMGGRLVVIGNDAENRFLIHLLAAAGLDTSWLGATDEKTEGRWIWVDGTPMKYSNWNLADRQPNNKKGEEHYLMVILSRRQLWCDQPDRAENAWHPGFVCQWDVNRTVARKDQASVTAARVADATPREAIIQSGSWSIEGDALIQSSNKGFSRLAFGDRKWSNYDFEFDARYDSGREGNWTFFHYSPSDRINFYTGGANRTSGLTTIVDGKGTNKSRPGVVEYGRWYKVKVEVRGPECRCYLDGNELFFQRDDRLTSGMVGFGTNSTAVRFRNIVVTSPEGKVLFKGLPSLPTAAKSTDAFQPGSVWASNTMQLTVLERKGDRFKAMFESKIGNNLTRELHGIAKDGRVEWYRRDVIAIKGGQGGDNSGTIQDGKMIMKWSTPDGSGGGNFTLDLQRK